MKQKKLERMASEDAQRMLAADMFYGEGAGTRRKLLEAELSTKFTDIAGYSEIFTSVYDSLDKNAFAKAAIKERKRIDAAAKAGKNFRAIKAGNFNHLSSGLYVGVVGYAFLYHTEPGIEVRKAVVAKAKKVHAKLRREFNKRDFNLLQDHQD